MLLDFIRQRFSGYRAAQRARLAVADGDSAAFLSRFGSINFELASRIDGQGLRGGATSIRSLATALRRVSGEPLDGELRHELASQLKAFRALWRNAGPTVLRLEPSVSMYTHTPEAGAPCIRGYSPALLNGVTVDDLCGDLAYLLNVAGTRYGVEVDPVFGVSVREVPSLLPPPMGESAAPPSVLIKVEQGAKLQDLFE